MYRQLRIAYLDVAKIRYDSTLPGPSYREVETNLHHSFKRCAELIGDPEVARQRFQELKRKRIKERAAHLYL